MKKTQQEEQAAQAALRRDRRGLQPTEKKIENLKVLSVFVKHFFHSLNSFQTSHCSRNPCEHLLSFSSQTEYKEFSVHFTAIEKAQKEIVQALQAREELYLKETQARTQLQMQLDTTRRQYNLMYPRLQLIFPDHPRLVESFFLSLRNRPSQTSSEDTPSSPE